jgi:alanine racemase
MKFLDVTQAIVSEEYAEALAATGYRNKCQFAIDTGMNRIGLDGDKPSECERIIRKFANVLDINGIFTHLCVADSSNESDKEFTKNQIDKFDTVAELLKDMELPYIHCCNSAGGIKYLDQCKSNSIVRLGIVMYGLKPDVANKLPEGIKSPLSWKSVVSVVKEVRAGEFLGYGRSFKVDKPMMIATVTTGYADGFNRHLSNKGFVLIHGQKAPIVGRICMDQTLVDVTNIPDVKMGDRVTLLGIDGVVEYNADDMAQDLGTIGYEIVCNISKRVQRFYRINELMIMSD